VVFDFFYKANVNVHITRNVVLSPIKWRKKRNGSATQLHL